MVRMTKFCRKQRAAIAISVLFMSFIGASLGVFGLSARLLAELTTEVRLDNSHSDHAPTPPPESSNGSQGLSLQPVWLSTVLEKPMLCSDRMAPALRFSERSGFRPLLERPPRV